MNLYKGLGGGGKCYKITWTIYTQAAGDKICKL